MKKKIEVMGVNGCHSLEEVLRSISSKSDKKYFKAASSIRSLLIAAINEGQKKGLPNRDENGCLANYIAGKLARLIHVYDFNGESPPIEELEDGEF